MQTWYSVHNILPGNSPCQPLSCALVQRCISSQESIQDPIDMYSAPYDVGQGMGRGTMHCLTVMRNKAKAPPLAKERPKLTERR